MDFKMFFI